jgi:hypothetical protein
LKPPLEADHLWTRACHSPFMSRRHVNTFITSRKQTVTCELDSHANTCVIGPNCVILEFTDQDVNVSAYSDHLETMNNVPIVTVATAYDDPSIWDLQPPE